MIVVKDKIIILREVATSVSLRWTKIHFYLFPTQRQLFERIENKIKKIESAAEVEV